MNAVRNSACLKSCRKKAGLSDEYAVMPNTNVEYELFKKLILSRHPNLMAETE